MRMVIFVLVRHTTKPCYIRSVGTNCGLKFLYELHTSGSCFPLYTDTMDSLSPNIWNTSSFDNTVIRKVIHLVPISPEAFIISLTTPVGPAFQSVIAVATSYQEMRKYGPITQRKPLQHSTHSQHLGASPYLLIWHFRVG